MEDVEEMKTDSKPFNNVLTIAHQSMWNPYQHPSQVYYITVLNFGGLILNGLWPSIQVKHGGIIFLEKIKQEDVWKDPSEGLKGGQELKFIT